MAKSKKVKPLDQEELDLEKALTNVDVSKLSKPSAKTKQKFNTAAAKFVKTETKMNIRIDPLELDEIKKRAAVEGLKYQSLVKSVLHKYVTGQLIERKAG